MRRSTTALLLSALVLPGAGHFYLKHAGRGAALMAISLICLWQIVTQVMQQASAVFDQALTSGGAIDIGHVTDLANQASTVSGGVSTLATLGLTVCWVAGMIDSYRLGKRQDPPA